MMGDKDNSQDWPTLSDSNGACSSVVKNKHGNESKDKQKLNDSSNSSTTNRKKETSDVKTEIADGADGLDNASTSTNSQTGARRKKQQGKTKWSRVPIDVKPYRPSRSERNYNESRTFAMNGQRFNNHVSANNFANGHENSKGRAYRGGRGGRGYRFRRENAANSEVQKHAAVYYQEAVYASQISRTGFQNVNYSESLRVQIMRQIEYYFSEENLIKDSFLRRRMDEQGYVDLTVVAAFPRIKRLTTDFQLILEAVKKSSHLEVSDDIKVRPVVNPLCWPLKEEICEPSSSSTSARVMELLTAQMYGISIDQSVYHHIAKPHISSELSWTYIPVDDKVENDVLFCVYPQVESNSLGIATANSGIPNGHVSSEHLNSPNSDLNCEVTSQFIPNDCEIKNSAIIGPQAEIPIHVDSYDIDCTADDSNISNGQTCSSDQVSVQSNVENSSQLSDFHTKNASYHPVNGFCPRVDSDGIGASACDLNICNEFAFSSDLQNASEMSAYNYFGQMSNGVLMYNSGGRYFVVHSSDILESCADSSDEKSALHNKSPEPSR